MIGNLLPFLMFGILAAAVLAKPLAKQRLVPVPVALMLLGFVSSEIWVLLGQDTGLRWQILRDLVFYLFLPVLIFEASININVRLLRREGILVFSLAVPLLLIATFISAAVIYFLIGNLLGNIWLSAILCGAMICATDPTTVSNILNGKNTPGRAVSILEGESLINDATTITLFVMISSILTLPGYEVDLPVMAGQFLLILLGSMLVGLFLGWLFNQMIKPLDDVVLTTSVTLVLAFVSFWAGEHILGWSGVVSTLSAGLTIAWLQRTSRGDTDVAFALGSWRTLGFLADAMLFFLVGMSITIDMFQANWLAMLVGTLAGLISRAVIIYLGAGPLSRLPRQRPLSFADQNLMFWGGIRGAIAIALALSLNIDIPHWYTIQSMVYGVALFSLVFQSPLFSYLIVRRDESDLRDGQVQAAHSKIRRR
jgi:CPA1 family monovalent cation:H+ antiporter